MIIPAQQKLNSFKRGFTLIELLIVIAILGILAAAVLVAINPAKRQNQARDTKTQNDISQVSSALQAYFTSEGGTYPDLLNDLVTNGDLRSLPVSPQGPAYTYVVSPGGCAGTVASPCTQVLVRNPLLDPDTAGNVWCFRSSTGVTGETTVAACTTP